MASWLIASIQTDATVGELHLEDKLTKTQANPGIPLICGQIANRRTCRTTRSWCTIMTVAAHITIRRTQHNTTTIWNSTWTLDVVWTRLCTKVFTSVRTDQRQQVVHWDTMDLSHLTKRLGLATSQSYPLVQGTHDRTFWMLRQKQSTVPASDTEPLSTAAKKSQSFSTALTAGIDKLFESVFETVNSSRGARNKHKEREECITRNAPKGEQTIIYRLMKLLDLRCTHKQ